MSSSSSSSSRRTTNTYDTDNRQFVLDSIDGPAVVSDGAVNLTYTDQGAVEAGRDLGLAALDYSAESTSEAFKFSRDVQREATQAQRAAVREAVGASQYALDYVDDANRDEGARNVETLIKWGGAAAIAAVAIPGLIAAMRG